MHYIVQENVFKEFHYDKLFKALERLELPYTVVRLFPFVNKIVALDDIPDDIGNYNVDDLPEFVPPTKNVFCFGAIKLARIAAEHGWYPGSMMNENHDYMVYKDHWKDNLLNYDSKIYKVVDDFDWGDDETKFIRPTEDTKAFTGQEFTKKEWLESREHALHNFKSPVFNEETLVQVSTPKAIHKEIRCWVVDGKVVTASTYRVANEFNINGDVFPEELEFAQRMVDLFQLNEAFVIDVCVSDKGMKIVEAGCINCAGFYSADLLKAVNAIDQHFNKKKKVVNLAEMSEEERSGLVSKHRIRVLAKYINKNYIQNDEWMDKAGRDLRLIIQYELIKGLDQEFAILRDDPNDPLILELIREKTVEIIKEIYK